MPNTNIHIIQGHLGADPELKTTSKGSQFCKARVATNFGKNHVDWHSVIVWGSDAEALGECKKGDAVECHGRVEHREYEGKWYTTTVCDFAKKLYTPRKQDEPAEQGHSGDDDDLPF